MFSLVVAVLATLVALAIGIATLFYLGGAFQHGGTKAWIAQADAAQSQISAAQTLYQTETGGQPIFDASPGDAVEYLVNQSYLSSAPTTPNFAASGAKWEIHSVEGNPVVTVDMDESSPAAQAFCKEVAEQNPGHAGCTSDVTTLSVSK